MTETKQKLTDTENKILKGKQELLKKKKKGLKTKDCYNQIMNTHRRDMWSGDDRNRIITMLLIGQNMFWDSSIISGDAAS